MRARSLGDKTKNIPWASECTLDHMPLCGFTIWLQGALSSPRTPAVPGLLAQISLPLTHSHQEWAGRCRPPFVYGDIKGLAGVKGPSWRAQVRRTDPLCPTPELCGGTWMVSCGNSGVTMTISAANHWVRLAPSGLSPRPLPSTGRLSTLLLSWSSWHTTLVPPNGRRPGFRAACP